jgi:tetratricopeptide (TPR) repeat protein
MVGKTVSHYRVLSELGSGGMGVVYRAEDLLLGREVALKFLPPEMLADHDALERFRREARLASSLNHPGICIVHDVDEGHGPPFIVMELVEGASLATQILQEPMPSRRVVEIGVEMLEALGAAHHRGIIHRDVKPANIFVMPSGRVKVLDFGLAKSAPLGPSRQATTPEDSARTVGASEMSLTTPGFQVGTFAYMSPEQARGETVDARTDLFSAGAVLYEIATGQRAFRGENVAIVCDQVLNRQPALPRSLNPEIPAALEAIVMKALAKRPQDRYQSAEEMAAELRSMTAPAEVLPLVMEPIAEAPRGPWRWRAIAVAASVVVAAVAMVAVMRVKAATPLTDRDSIVVAAFTNTTGEQVFDETLSQALNVQLSQSPFLAIVPDRQIRDTLRQMDRPENTPLTGALPLEVCTRGNVKAMLEPTIARIGSLYVVTLEAFECSTGRSIAAADAKAERKEDVLKALGSVTSVVRQKLGETPLQQFDLPIEQATTPSLEALQAYTLGRAERAKGKELESIPFFRRALELDPDFAAAHTMLSTVYGVLGELAQSEEHARDAYARRERVTERERYLITYQYHDRVTGDQLESLRTLDLWKATYPRDFVPANARALIFNHLGLFERAVDEAKEALARQPDHPFPLSNLASAYRGLNNLTEARRWAQRAIDLKIETSPTRRLLYQIELMEGHAAAADAHLRWAHDRPREFDLVSARAQWEAWQGRMHDARDSYRLVTELTLRRNLSETAAGYQAHHALTEALYGYKDEALAVARQSLFGDRDQSSSPDAVPRYRAAAALALAGDPEAADAVLRETLRRYPQSTLTKTVMRPVVGGASAIVRGQYADAIARLKEASDYELGTVATLVPVYLRGVAYLGMKDGVNAAEQFQRILDHRGTDPFGAPCALAQLGLARALAVQGKTAAATAAYQAFFTAWSSADADLPILREAHAEAESLRPQRFSRILNPESRIANP